MLHIKKHQFYVKKELLSLLRIYRKSETSAQTDGRIATNGPLYTGYFRAIIVQVYSHINGVMVLL